jgi:predicted ATP-dependent serine protease
LREVSRLGFRQILVPPGTAASLKGAGCRLIEVGEVGQAISWLRDAASA